MGPTFGMASLQVFFVLPVYPLKSVSICFLPCPNVTDVAETKRNNDYLT